MKRLSVPAFLAAISLLCGCESAYEAMKADPAPLTPFLPSHSLLQPQRADFPFDRFWYSKTCDWKKFKKIKVAHVDISHMLKNDWWQSVSTAKAVDMKSQAESIGEYMRNAFIRQIMYDPGNSFLIVDKADSETIVIELAITQLVPTKAFFNAVGTTAGFFIPGAGLVTVIDAGCVAMECKLIDGGTGETVLMLTDRERDDAALINIDGFTWYGHAKHIIDGWAEQFDKLAVTKDKNKLKKDFPFSIISI